MTHIALALTLISQPALAQGEPPVPEAMCRIDDISFPLIEGQEFVVAANYRVPEGSARLNCEMKNAQNIVIAAARREVTGAGQASMRLTAPPAAEAPQVRIALWLGENWQEPLVPIVQSEAIEVLTEARAELMQSYAMEADAVMETLAWERSDGGNVAVLRDDLPGVDPATADRYIAALEMDGIAATPLTGEQAANPFVLSTDHFDALLLTDARTFPAAALGAVGEFVGVGGDLVAVGAPAFSTLVAKFGDGWVSREQYLQRLAEIRPEKMLLDFEGAELPPNRRATNDTSQPQSVDSGEGADGTDKSLHVSIGNLTGWDTLELQAPEGAFPEGHTLTCFWAKGGPRTTQLSLEWREKDGSRWIATVPLTKEWRPYSLQPADFAFWQDSGSVGRGGPGDVLNPANVAALSVGLAFTHTSVPGGEHEYWLDELGSAPNSLGEAPVFDAARVPVIDTVSPAYKVYPNRNAATLDTSAGAALLSEDKLPMPKALFSCHPRPQGTGLEKGRGWRWIPLVQVRGEDQEVSGTLATLTLHVEPPNGGSAVLSITSGDDDYAAQDDVRKTVVALTKRMLDGAFLYEGGTQHFACFNGDPVPLGAKVANFGRTPSGPLAVETLITPKGSPAELYTKRLDVAADAGDIAPVSDTWQRGRRAEDEYEVTTTLKRDGEVIDELKHPLLVWKREGKPRYITTRDGDFYLASGEKWFPYGVNYMPSSECGIEDQEYFEYWLDPKPYDPVVTERDLKRIRAMGLNNVSVFVYHRSLGSGNLLDLLIRCERNELKVNLSLRPGTPLDFLWPEMGEIISEYRLAEMDNIFVYDLAWEPVFGNYALRKRWDAEWEKWVVERYGGIADAEADWGVPIPRAEGAVTSPGDEQVSTDSEHRVMVAAYRRFLDDLLSKAHLRAAQKVKSLDPNHLISFRMNTAGDPTVGASWLAYDFSGLEKSVDVMEPEGYGRLGDWDRVAPGWFTAAYSRCVAPSRPVMWAEFGRHVWSQAAMTQDPDQLKTSAQFYRDFLTMVLKSRANGAVGWFYPGGYRVNERSDYGIIDPDGTWREITEVIHEFSGPMTSEREPIDPGTIFDIDRDADARGLQGIWAAVGEEFMDATERRRFPSLRHPGEGLTSAEEPVVAVGNRPYNGSNPPKYLNAEFNVLEVLNAEGTWVSVETDGTEVAVDGDLPVKVRAAVGNIGWATWLAPSRQNDAGGVYLVTTEDSPVTVKRPIPADAARCDDAIIPAFELTLDLEDPNTLTFEMEAENRARFGEKLEVVFVAAE